jgi:hypothetical protein
MEIRKNERLSDIDPWEKIEWCVESEPGKKDRVPKNESN